VSASHWLVLVYTFLPGAFLIDLMVFVIFVWWGHKKVSRG